MNKYTMRLLRTSIILGLLIIFSACTPQAAPVVPTRPSLQSMIATPIPGTPAATPLPTRPPYQPGELVDYIAQSGDTLPALAARFNTSISEIRKANPIIPQDATTMPAGFPMKIPIYFHALWGSPFQILPDSLFINGPAQRGFDPVSYVQSMPGWFKNYEVPLEAGNLKGGEIVAHIAVNYSISPRLLLALVEYQTAGLTQPVPGVNPNEGSPLGFNRPSHEGLYRELAYAANMMNNIYYQYKMGEFDSFERQDRSLEYPDPWQNAATVTLQYYFSRVLSVEQYLQAISAQGFLQTYTALYGDPWANLEAHIPGSLTQPAMALPFATGTAWSYTGGPHTAWGEGLPYSAVDFAPPAVVGGCSPARDYATAVADGVIVRKGIAEVVLDLDGDGDERTGWTVYYLHLSTITIPPVGTVLKTGDPIGLPSCEGGRATGTHVHIARKYNGEWMPAGGVLAFNLGGWVVVDGSEPYQGKLVRFGREIRACDCSDQASQVVAGNEPQ